LIFSNLFHRDDTYDLLENLCGKAMQRVLKSSSTNPPPGQATNDTTINGSGVAPDGGSELLVSSTISESSNIEDVKEKRKNQQYINQFSLPMSEHVVLDCETIFTMPGLPESFGRAYLSETFLCFLSEKKDVRFALPLFAVKKVERLGSKGDFQICLETWHSTRLQLTIFLGKAQFSNFTTFLRQNLANQSKYVKTLSNFFATCTSEALLAGKKYSDLHGLGVTFGYPQATKYAKFACFHSF
jgi:hypothetical protein